MQDPENIQKNGIQYSLWSLTKRKITQGNILCRNQVRGEDAKFRLQQSRSKKSKGYLFLT